MLEKVLQIENETGLDLISHQELVTIQQQWHYDGGFDFSVAEIYFNLKNKHIMIPNTLREKREKEEISLLKDAAAQYGVNHNHILALLSEEREQLVYIRRKDIHVEIRNKINRFVVENSLEERWASNFTK